MSHPGANKPDIGVVIPPTAEQQAAARAFIQRAGMDDEAQILAMLGLET